MMFVHLSRLLLLTLAHVFGSLGVFYVWLCFMGLAGAGTYAIALLGAAIALVVALDGIRPGL